MSVSDRQKVNVRSTPPLHPQLQINQTTAKALDLGI